MNGYDIDRTLADWFHADARVPEPIDGVDRALAGVRRRKPRPAWLAGLGSRWGWAAPRGGSGLGVRTLQGSGVRWSTTIILVLALGLLVGGALLVGSGLLESALPTARLGQLAYASDGDIFVADWDGRNPVRIADGLAGGKEGCGLAGYWAEGPMWSPDGQHLAYRSERSQVVCERPASDLIPSVILSDPAGRVVAEFPGVGWQVAWSPDSSRVATWLGRYPMTRIGVYGLDGVRQAVLSIPPGKQPPGDNDPVWSPDGQSLLIPLEEREGPNQYGEPGVDVWEVPVDGSPPRQIPADDPRSHRFSTRSPDGSRVAYISDGMLVVAAADGSQPQELTGAVDGMSSNDYFRWSPTGDRIAVVAEGPIGEEPPDSYLRVVDVASGSVATVIPAASGDFLMVNAFSPDGDRVLFSRYGAGGATASLWSVNADGSDPQVLIDGTVDGDWQTLQAEPGPSDKRSTPSPVGLP